MGFLNSFFGAINSISVPKKEEFDFSSFEKPDNSPISKPKEKTIFDGLGGSGTTYGNPMKVNIKKASSGTSGLDGFDFGGLGGTQVTGGSVKKNDFNNFDFTGSTNKPKKDTAGLDALLNDIEAGSSNINSSKKTDFDFNFNNNNNGFNNTTNKQTSSHQLYNNQNNSNQITGFNNHNTFNPTSFNTQNNFNFNPNVNLGVNQTNVNPADEYNLDFLKPSQKPSKTYTFTNNNNSNNNNFDFLSDNNTSNPKKDSKKDTNLLDGLLKF
jgi:hypothetical protein